MKRHYAQFRFGIGRTRCWGICMLVSEITQAERHAHWVQALVRMLDRKLSSKTTSNHYASEGIGENCESNYNGQIVCVMLFVFQFCGYSCRNCCCCCCFCCFFLFFSLSAYVFITYSFDLRQEECSFRAIFIATNETHSNWLSSISHTVSIYGKHISALKI